jgi:hypothetical protein
MNALARQYIGQGNTCGKHFHPHFTVLWFGALFFDHLKCIGPAIVSDDDACVFRRPLSPLPGLELVQRNEKLRRGRPPSGLKSTGAHLGFEPLVHNQGIDITLRWMVKGLGQASHCSEA